MLIESFVIYFRLSSRLKCITADANIFITNGKYSNFQHGWNQVGTYSLKYCVTRMLVIISNKTKMSGWPRISLVEVRCHRQIFSFISKMIWKLLVTGTLMVSTIPKHWTHGWRNLMRIFRSYDNPQEQLSNWRMFFIYCSEVFSFNDGNEHIVVHYLFSKQSKSKLWYAWFPTGRWALSPNLVTSNKFGGNYQRSFL